MSSRDVPVMRLIEDSIENCFWLCVVKLPRADRFLNERFEQ